MGEEEKLKECPYCAEQIKPGAIKCKYCKSDIGYNLANKQPIKTNIKNINYILLSLGATALIILSVIVLVGYLKQSSDVDSTKHMSLEEIIINEAEELFKTTENLNSHISRFENNETWQIEAIRLAEAAYLQLEQTSALGYLPTLDRNADVEEYVRQSYFDHTKTVCDVMYREELIYIIESLNNGVEVDWNEIAKSLELSNNVLYLYIESLYEVL